MSVATSPPSAPRLPERIHFEDFSPLEKKQQEIEQSIQELTQKFKSSDNAYTSALSVKSALNVHLNLLKPVGEKDSIHLDSQDRIEFKVCKYALYQTQKDFLDRIQSVLKASNAYYDFASSKNLPGLNAIKERIKNLPNKTKLFA